MNPIEGGILATQAPGHPLPRILIVDDEPHVRKFLRLSLQAENFSVLEAATAEDAVYLALGASPDAIILDLGLPDLDGRQVIRDVRQTSDVPIVVLSGRTEDSEKIAALEQGADDYITKPFAVRNLIERVQAVLGQRNLRQCQPGDSIATGDITIHLDQPTVTRRGHEKVALSEEEHKILRELALHGGRVMTYGRLARAIWNGEEWVEERRAEQRGLLQKRINALRYKLEEQPSFPRYIVTEPAIGYRLEMHPPE